MKYISLLLVVTCVIACKDNSSKKEKPNDITSKRSVTTRSFGSYEGKAVTEFSLTNGNGASVSILDYGATVTNLNVPGHDKKMYNVVLGYDSLAGYLQKSNPYFGCIVGRYANRIANGKFTLDGKTYTLAQNDHGNSLHGGNKGYDKVMWTAAPLPGDSSIRFTYQSKDGEEGYPGNLSIEVIYTLTVDNALMIEYSATTDKPTPVNLTNHCYFNLSGGSDSTVSSHVLELNASKYTVVNDVLIPTGEQRDVTGTPMDFRWNVVGQKKTIGSPMDSTKGGYDHNWLIDRKGTGLEYAATLEDNSSGISMRVLTTEPGIQFYSGNFLDGTLQYTRNGQKYGRHAGLCLETQHYPDSPNQPAFPTTILKPGERYSHTTVYAFGLTGDKK